MNEELELTEYERDIRTTELCKLKVSQVDLKEQTVIVVNGKGGKKRITAYSMRHGVAGNDSRSESDRSLG